MFIIIYVVQYSINLHQLHKNIKNIVIIVLIHLTTGFKKGSIYKLLGKVLTTSVI